MPIEPVLISIADASRALGIGKTKMYELISKNALTTVQIGTRRLVTLQSVRAFGGEA